MSSVTVYAQKTRSNTILTGPCVHGRVGWVQIEEGKDREEYIFDREAGFVPRKRFFEIKRGRAIENERKHANVPFGEIHRAKRREEGAGGASACRPASDRLLRGYAMPVLVGLDPARAASV